VRISFARLLVFIAGAVFVSAGIADTSPVLGVTGAALLAGFFILVFVHARVLAARDQAQRRQDVHERHAKRASNEWTELPWYGHDELLPAGHPYAPDVDLLGHGSLVQRIDCTRTRAGERALARWLSGPADHDTVAARQQAVQELAPAVELRQELEASARSVTGEDKLDPSPFLQFTRRQSFFDQVPWLLPIIHILPPVTVALLIAAQTPWVPGGVWLAPLLGQMLLVFFTGSAARDAFDLVAARRGYVEAFHRTLVVAEQAEFESPLLKQLQRRLSVEGQPPSQYLRRLDRWAGLAEFRHQFPLHLVANWLLLWDMHILWRLERWTRDVGPHAEDVFEALGELEALCSFATLQHVDASATMPEVTDSEQAFDAEQLAHPLLPPETRVPNDLRLEGPGTALIVTGSNMAGKSTLLRAVGLNIALALGGGPVIAKGMRVPRVRLRASMRADDSLQEGASYFHAELTKLQRVIEHADEGPPVFFLVDELLRGTNARARHLGARAVLLHLLERRGMGLVATHDVALAALEQEYPTRISNVHFTDVMQDGEMIFDYRLRSGVVRTSNALRLLRQAGIDVPDDDSVDGNPLDTSDPGPHPPGQPS
jgi:hypothetical protein